MSTPVRKRGSAPSASRSMTTTVRALIGALIAALMALVMAVGGMAQPARAAGSNAAIVVGPVTIERVGDPTDGQATVGDRLTVSGDWDASDADPQPGDTFTIGLPAELAFPAAIPFDLYGGDGVVWGTCLTDPDQGIATCTLSDEVSGKDDVKGTWSFEVEAVAATVEKTVTFDLNGRSQDVELPGGGGIDDGIDLPDSVSKTGSMNANNWSMTWTLDIPGANLVAAGQNVAHVSDTLGAGHQLCDPTGFAVRTVRGDTTTDVTSIATMNGVPGDTSFDFDLTGPFNGNVTYRVTYQTCTPDGEIDPAGTTYDNTAQIAGWGEAGVGIGTVTNKPWHTDLTKSGSVLGGADRNGKIAWTVTVPGDKLVGKDGFTLTETLGAGHHVGADTISGITVTEQYGPNPGSAAGMKQNITGQLTSTTESSSATGFQVKFDITDPATLSFKANDWRYIITYSTYLDSTELPEGGTAFSNTADVDGTVVTKDATVPGRTYSKTGSINGSIVTIDGVAHMPQTTLGWAITIPGEELADLTGPLTLTDTLSDTQAVCEAGDPTGGAASQLGLAVQARDQISGGGLATVDLTGQTAVSVDGKQLTFTVQPPQGLPLPGGSTADGFSREYQYILTYTTCTASGGMDAPGTVYGNDVEGSGVEKSNTVTQSHKASGTGQGVTRGSVTIDKALADTTGKSLVPADTKFTVHVKEIDPSDTVQNEYDLQVPLDGSASGLNARGTGWKLELTEPTFPSVPGVSFGTPVFSGGDGVTVSDGGAKAVVAVTPGANISVHLTNNAQLGAVSVAKAVDGGAAGLVDPDRTYAVTAHIDTSALGANVPAQPDRTVDLTAGAPATVLDNLPVGATVSFSEAQPADDDTLTWSAPTFSPASVVVGADPATPAAVVVTNHVERTVGTFSVAKTVTGDQAGNPAVPDSVTVTATWNQEGTPGSTTLTLPTDGTPVPLGENLLIGTQVTLTETPLADGSSIAWGAPVWTGTGVATDGASAVVTIGRTADATVSLENHAATSTAGISLIKGIAGAAAGEVDPSTTFPVTATWTDADGNPQSRDLTINAATPTPLGVELPAGTVVTLTEGTAPQIDTVVWGPITISGNGVTDNGGGAATVVVSDQQGDVNFVTVTNEADWAPGSFSIAKNVQDVLVDDPDVPEAVTVHAAWTDEDGLQSADISVPTDGTVVAFPQQLAHGTEVTLTEDALDGNARFTWASPTWSGDRVVAGEDGSATVTIGAADVAKVSLVNKAVASNGSLTITKSLTGEAASQAASTPFPVTLTWTDLLGVQQTRNVDVVAGTPVTVDGLPLGTEVTATEGSTKLADKVRWTGAQWSAGSDNVTVSKKDGKATAVLTVAGEPGATAAVGLQNEVDVDHGLAVTGVDGAMRAAGGIAVIALLGGAVLLIVRRRQRGTHLAE